MSTPTSPQAGNDPNLDSFHTGIPEMANLTFSVSESEIVPPDPLLTGGSFINVSPPISSAYSPSDYETPNEGDEIVDQKPSVPDASIGSTESVPTPKKTLQRGPAAGESVPAPERPQQRRPAAAAATESPSWLPPGWIVEDRVRVSGATAGVVDKYYFDPVSGHKFRSKKEVLYFLENGTKRKRRDADVEGSSRGSKQKKSGIKAKSKPLNFNYFDVPNRVSWVLTEEPDTWTPYIGNVKVPYPIRREWARAYEASAAASAAATAANINGYQPPF